LAEAEGRDATGVAAQAGAAVKRQAQVVGFLEGLEGAHHLGMRHHRVERNARLGLKFVRSVDIHLSSPCGWM
jgi:hypothetical protein